MTSKPITALRQRMIEDMTIRRLKERTQDFYQRVTKYAQHFRRSPGELDYEHVRQYQLHLVQSGWNPGYLNRTMSALRFFYRVTMGRPDALEMIALVPEPPRKLRQVLTPEEVVRLIEAAPSRKYRCAFSVAYGAGLRSSEVVSLKVSDIDSKRMVLRIENGKGGKDRLAKLSPLMLEELRAWWKVAKPKVYLFPSQIKSSDHITARQYHRACRQAAIRARIDRSVHPHMLRHSFATHLLEQGTDVRVIQTMLGHQKLETTAIYAAVSPKLIQSVEGPLDLLPFHPAQKKRSRRAKAPPA
jgi:integrase/recombinase XerD